MQEETKRSASSDDTIRTLLDRARRREADGAVQERVSDGSAEFVFDAPPTEGGLVFETDADTLKREDPPSSAAVREEFSLPPSFSVDVKYAAAFANDTPTHHTYQPYIPTFTEASENYRMTGRTTRPTEDEEKAPSMLRKREELRGPIVEVVTATSDAADAPSDAATAEETPDAEPTLEQIVVHTEPPVHRLEDFTFPSREDGLPTRALFDAEEPSEVSVAAEREQIRRLLGTDVPSREAVLSTEDVMDKPTDEPMDEIGAEQTVPVEDVYRADALDSAPTESSIVEPTVTSRGIFTARPSTLPDPDTDDSTQTAAFSAGTASTPTRGAKRAHTREREYQMYSDSTKLKNRFLDGLMAHRVRLGVLLLLSLATLALDLLGLFSVDLRLLLRLPDFDGLTALFELQLVICAVLLALPEITRICKALFAKKTLLPVCTLASLVFVVTYDLYIILAGIYSYALYGALFVFGVLCAVWASYVEREAMFMGFKLISVKGTKGAFERVMTRELPEENVALDGMVDEYRSYTARLFRTSFVSGFFRRHQPTGQGSAYTVFLLVLLASASVIVGAVAGLLGGGARGVLEAATMTYLTALPAAALLARPFAFFSAQRCCFASDSAVLGEASMLEYADVDVVTFEDTEIFGRGDVALKRVLIYGDKSRLPQALRQMASLFSAVGGPLHTLFSDTLDRRPLPASHVEMQTDGVTGISEGATVHAGSAEYMRRIGFTVPTDGGRESAATTRVLYLAEAGIVYAKFIFRYALSEEFSQLLPVLREKKITPLVYTRDPNVTGELLLSLSMGSECMRSMHVLTPQVEDEAVPTGSSGMITLGSKMDSLSLLLLAKTYVRYVALTERVSTAFGIAGILGAATLYLLHLPTIVLPWLVGWQLLMTLVSLLGGRAVFSLRKKREELLENEKELSHE